jgi:hypothetical protein
MHTYVSLTLAAFRLRLGAPNGATNAGDLCLS